jgi:hypothetical protein
MSYKGGVNFLDRSANFSALLRYMQHNGESTQHSINSNDFFYLDTEP